MASKTFCPIMTIGFAPPEEGKRDDRICMKDCAWYNLVEETCNINVIASLLEQMEVHESDTLDAITDLGIGGTPDYEDYGGLEKEWNDRWGTR